MKRQPSTLDTAKEQIVADWTTIEGNPTPHFYQHVKAPNDRNGNPQRCYVLFDGQGTIRGVFDEGYAGGPQHNGLWEGAIEIYSVEVSVKEYKSFIRYGKENGCLTIG